MILKHSPESYEVKLVDDSQKVDEISNSLLFDLICTSEEVKNELTMRSIKSAEGNALLLNYPMKKPFNPWKAREEMLIDWFEYELDGRRFPKESMFQKIVDLVVAIGRCKFFSWAC